MSHAPYSFTSDWAKAFAVNASRLFGPLKDQPLSYLEIGLYEGRSACFMLDTILLHPSSKMVGIDLRLLPAALSNLERHAAKARLIEGWSADVLPKLEEQFDIVYIDGSHLAKDCLFDSVHAWRLSRRFILWDDYRNEQSMGVRLAVQSFLACIPASEFQIVCDNWQLGVEKF